MKTIASLALLGLAFGFEDHEFNRVSAAHSTFRPLPSHVHGDHEYMRTAYHRLPKSQTPGVTFDDVDNELALIGLAHDVVKANQVLKGQKVSSKVAHFDDEFFSEKAFYIQKKLSELRKRPESVFADDELYRPIIAKPIINVPVLTWNKKDKPVEDSELSILGELETELARIDSKSENLKDLVRNLVDIVKEIAQHDDIDNELHKKGSAWNDGWSRYDQMHGGGKLGDGYGYHNGFDDEDDDFLTSLADLIKDGLKIHKDMKDKDYASLINDGAKTVKDVQDVRGKRKLWFN